VLEHEDGPLVRCQAAEPAFELVAIRDPIELVGPARSDGLGVVGEEMDDRRSPALVSCLGDAGADDQAVAPGLEPVRVTEPRQLVPDGGERLLEGVLGEVVVAQDPVGDREEPSGRQPDEGFEGLLIAAGGSPHEVPLHHCHLSQSRVAARCGLLGKYGETRRRSLHSSNARGCVGVGG
jgi:hypothetical protein